MSELFAGIAVFQIAGGSQGLAKKCLALFDCGGTFIMGQPCLQLGSLDIRTKNRRFQLACTDRLTLFH